MTPPPPESPDGLEPSIRVIMMPKDTNAHGTIFGGVILSHIDLASGVEAFKVAPHLYVTKAMREVEFSVASETPEVYFEKMARMGGVVEEFIEGSEKASPSAQLRKIGRAHV